MANNPNQKPSPTIPSSTPEYANKSGGNLPSSKPSPSKSSPDSSKSSPSQPKDKLKVSGGGNCGC